MLLIRGLVSLLILTITICDAANSQSMAVGFFPTPPPTVVLKHAVGVLLRYGVGMKAGGLTIETTTGPVVFYVSTSMKIDGKLISCTIPPHGSFRASTESCDDWPSTLTLGHSTVNVAYWDTLRTDIRQTVHVSNSMTIVTP